MHARVRAHVRIHVCTCVHEEAHLPFMRGRWPLGKQAGLASPYLQPHMRTQSART